MAEEKNTQENHSDSGLQTTTEEKTEVRKPRLYRVLLLNDDYTPMEFVVWILQTVFHKPHQEATRLMMDVHTQGKGLCGIYSYDVARTKVYQVKVSAQKNGHPLECIMEVEEG